MNGRVFGWESAAGIGVRESLAGTPQHPVRASPWSQSSGDRGHLHDRPAGELDKGHLLSPNPHGTHRRSTASGALTDLLEGRVFSAGGE